MKNDAAQKAALGTPAPTESKPEDAQAQACLLQQAHSLRDSVRRLELPNFEAMVRTFPNVNAQDERGMSALHYAAAIGARPCIRILVNSGKCDYTLADNQGRYAYELALDVRDFAVARLLAKKMALQLHERGLTL